MLNLPIPPTLHAAGDCAHELAVLLNSAYATLSNLKSKETYDAGLRRFRRDTAQYDGLPVSEWYGPPGESGPVCSCNIQHTYKQLSCALWSYQPVQSF